jgi:hypothetical protein
MKLLYLVVLLMTFVGTQAYSDPYFSCTVELGVDGSPCKVNWSQVFCPFYPKGIADVRLNIQGGNGSASVTYNGQSYLLECKLSDPKTQDFTCSGAGGFSIDGIPGDGFRLQYDVDNSYGDSEGCD